MMGMFTLEIEELSTAARAIYNTFVADQEAHEEAVNEGLAKLDEEEMPTGGDGYRPVYTAKMIISVTSVGCGIDINHGLVADEDGFKMVGLTLNAALGFKGEAGVIVGSRTEGTGGSETYRVKITAPHVELEVEIWNGKDKQGHDGCLARLDSGEAC